MGTYYLVKDADPNNFFDVDVSDLPVDGKGNVSIEDAAIAAIQQLGYCFSYREETDCCEGCHIPKQPNKFVTKLVELNST